MLSCFNERFFFFLKTSKNIFEHVYPLNLRLINSKFKKLHLNSYFSKLTKLIGWVFLTRGHVSLTKCQGLE
jgi:hypothetical protein